MPKFKYAGIDAGGRRRRGTVDAVIVDDARLQLAEQGLHNLTVEESAQFWRFQLTKPKVKRQELIHFSRQLAAFVRAGVPILDAIETLREEATNKKLGQILTDVDEALRKGETFSAAIARHGDTFPTFYTAILKSAELTGQLDVVLDQLATYLERDEATRRKVRAALTYPAVVLGVAAVAVVVLVVVALPKFQDFFAEFDARLPLTTRILLDGADWLENYGMFLAAGLIGVTALSALYMRTPGGRLRRDETILKLPVIGGIIRYAIVERFCRIVSAMVRGGVPAPEGMAVAADTLGNIVYRNAVEEIRDAMMRGEGMAEPIGRTGVFPGVAVQMIRVGEETGTLDEQLETAAQYFGGEAEYRMARLTDLLEPAVILAVGFVVGFVAIALVQAMYGIYDQVQIQ